jgi:Ala-tRNA(Pro) deacylase
MHDIKLGNGRPEDTAGMLPREAMAYNFLDSIGIPYARADHIDLAAYTMEDCKKIDAILDAMI